MTSVCELVMINDDVRSLILDKADASAVKKAAVANGMITLRQDALIKVTTGVTSIEEMVRAINSEEYEEQEG